MGGTFEGLTVAVLAIAPGLMFELGIERQVGFWRSKLSDRLLRFLAWSLAVHAALLPVTLHLLPQVADAQPADVLTNWRWVAVWGGAIVYVAVPFVVGDRAGAAVAARSRWAGWLIGHDPAPRAWDDLFANPDAVLLVRIQRKHDGSWIGGLYGLHGTLRSYAANFPQEPDLFLVPQVEVDPATGDIVLDDDGRVRKYDRGVWLAGDEIAVLEVLDVGTVGGTAGGADADQ